jgi:formate transporter
MENKNLPQNEDVSVKHYQMGEYLETVALKKANGKAIKTFISAILGGVFIAIGGFFATTVSAGAGTMPYGLVRFLMGIAFSLGLILVVIGGAELFTGTTIVSVALANKKINFWKLLKNWSIVYGGNFCGAILIALLIFLGNQYTFGNGAMGTAILNTALVKSHHTFLHSVSLGILANILVCLAIWLTYSTKSIAGKIMAMIMPIAAFVAAGFEHSVANMYFFPIALLIKNLDPVFVSTTKLNLANLTFSNFVLNNLIPVTIGNIIGGMAVWLTYNWLYKKEK